MGEPIDYRGISKKTMATYGVVTKGEDLVFPYPDGKLQTKSLEGKRFSWLNGSSPHLFGKDRFTTNGARAVTITEGPVDALSVYEMMGNYPVVAATSSSSAKKQCKEDYQWLNSFDRIYLCFDADTPGQEAAKSIASMFDFNKVFMVKLQGGDLKDANDYLKAGKSNEFKKAWWGAQRFLPEGVIAGYSAFDEIIDGDTEKPSIPYPFEGLQDMTYGIRQGELVLFTAQEGIGKTTMFRAIEHHILKTTKDNIGIIHLEENKARTLKGLVGYDMNQPIHLPDYSISNGEIKERLRALTGRDERLHIYSHFGSDDPDVILSTVRFLGTACDCKYIFLDHITMVVTGLGGEDERKALDYISTQLKQMTEDHGFTVFVVSHVNDEGMTRGSRNISKVADLRIDLDRDVMSTDPLKQRQMWLRVSKNRFSGKTGIANVLIFGDDTHTLTEYTADGTEEYTF